MSHFHPFPAVSLHLLVSSHVQKNYVSVSYYLTSILFFNYFPVRFFYIRRTRRYINVCVWYNSFNSMDSRSINFPKHGSSLPLYWVVLHCIWIPYSLYSGISWLSCYKVAVINMRPQVSLWCDIINSLERFLEGEQ